MDGNVLIIDDEDKLRSLLKRIIGLEGFTVSDANSLKAGLKVMERQPVDVVLCDVKLTDGNGVEFTDLIKKRFPETEIILLTAYGNIPDGIQSIKNGAFDYLTKGDDNARIIQLINKALEKKNLQTRISELEKKVNKKYSFENILGNSAGINEAKELARKVSATSTTILLLGETGTGKEVFAQAIHNEGPRKNKAFLAINCSSFSKELLESELFGYKAGAFTSASQDKKGLFEEADGGTLFMDEIGEIPLELQSKLLRILENGEFIKMGQTKTSSVNVRIIAATNRNLQEDVRENKFREDLFYRLNVFSITLPPLRERKKDIGILAAHFLRTYSAKSDAKPQSMSKDFLHAIESHSWRGNIRELKNVMERAVILSNGNTLELGDLPVELQTNDRSTSMLSAFDLSSVEKLHIQRVLNHTKNNKSEAARLMNIGLATLYRKIEEYKL